MSLGNREKHIIPYLYFQDAWDHWIFITHLKDHLSRRQSFTGLTVQPTFSLCTTSWQEGLCSLTAGHRVPYYVILWRNLPSLLPGLVFNYHVVCTKALCQFNYCLINGVLRVYSRCLAIY